MKSKHQGTVFLSVVFAVLLVSANLSTYSVNALIMDDTKQNDGNPSSSISTEDSKQYYAIIIGIEQYKENIIPDRLTVDETAIDVYHELLKGKNWNDENIKLLLNENATKTNIKNSIQEWLDPLEEVEDIILLYFIGKTRKTNQIGVFEDNTISFCFDSENNDRLKDKITDSDLDSWLDELESDHVGIVLDTSYAHKMNSLTQRGRMILQATSSLSPQVNPSDPIINHTVFSHYIIKGLEGFADDNEDGELSLDELFLYSKTESFKHSLQTMFEALTQFDFRYHLQSSTKSNRHFGIFSLFTLPFGWKRLADNGFGKHSNYATRGMTIFKDELYIGTQNNLLPQISKPEEEQMPYVAAAFFPDFYDVFGDLTTLPSRIAMHVMTFVSQGCEIWKYNYYNDSVVKVVGKNSLSGVDAGFGYHFNAAAAIMHVFNDYLYVGTWNTPLGSISNPERKGCEIWRTDDGTNWEQVVGHQAPYTPGGFGNQDNTGAWSIETYQDYLYVGTMNWDFSDNGGCEVWRSSDGLHWGQVVDHGFRPFMNDRQREKEAINTYAWNMEVFDDALYMGTFNSRVWLRDETGTGGQLWRTTDGTNWDKMMLPNCEDGVSDGFGEGENYGIRRMLVYNDELYVGIASSFFHHHGCEIWKFNGSVWTPVISDEILGVESDNSLYDGFGNTMNKYVWSMVVTNDNKLWVGTGNGQVYIPFLFKGGKINDYFTTETEGCEIWCFDGSDWYPIIKNELGLKPNGMGDSTNLGARSMIEYPKGSGNLVVGTFKLFNAESEVRDGCELWMRYVV